MRAHSLGVTKQDSTLQANKPNNEPTIAFFLPILSLRMPTPTEARRMREHK